VKYRDAELTGIPCRVSVGSRDLAEGMVEFAIRATGEKQRVPVAEAVRHVQQYLSAQRAAEASGGS
jgi:prolyl-tRNA synthetase